MRLILASGYDVVLRVSIHASVKDATGLSRPKRHALGVSIHASVKDATIDCYSA